MVKFGTGEEGGGGGGGFVVKIKNTRRGKSIAKNE